MPTSKESGSGRYVMSTNGWPQERWLAVIVLGALLFLILIRMGFRGVNVMGASVSVS